MSTLIKQGGYATETCFDVVTHRYAGSEISYIECLEIKNSPHGKPSFLVIMLTDTGYLFWPTVSADQGNKMVDCIASLGTMGAGIVTFKKILKERFNISQIFETESFSIMPWVYAKNLEDIQDDFAFPSDFNPGNDKYGTGKDFLRIEKSPDNIFFDVSYGVTRDHHILWKSGTESAAGLGRHIRPWQFDRESEKKAKLLWNRFLAGQEIAWPIVLDITLGFKLEIKKREGFEDDLKNGMLSLSLEVENDFPDIDAYANFYCWKKISEVKEKIIAWDDQWFAEIIVLLFGKKK